MGEMWQFCWFLFVFPLHQVSSDQLLDKPHLSLGCSSIFHGKKLSHTKQARKLQATLDGCNQNYDPLTRSLTGVKCRATSVAKNLMHWSCYIYHYLTQIQSGKGSEKDKVLKINVFFWPLPSLLASKDHGESKLFQHIFIGLIFCVFWISCAACSSN